MVVHFLQKTHLAPTLDPADFPPHALSTGLPRSGLTDLTLNPDTAEPEIAIHGTQLNALLVGFFGYWRQFSFQTDAVSIRTGGVVLVSDCAAAADTITAETMAPCRCFVVEDPIEPDENTARTLSDRNLEEVRVLPSIQRAVQNVTFPPPLLSAH
jgi:hypothetical protein